MAVETQELAVIKSGISSAMAESAGQFRQAATASAASITKVVKDISNIFAAQRRDLADLSNSINDVVHELEQTNSKFDNLERVFEESLSIQTAMRGDIKTMAISMKNMTDGIYQLDKNMQNVMTGPNSLLSGLTAGLTSGFSSVTGKLGEILLKGAPFIAGAAAGGGIGYMAGGGGAESMGGGGSATGAFKEKAPMIMERLQKDFGVTKEQAAGVVGSLAAETGGFTKLQEENPLEGGRGGYGWAQWTGPRRRQFEAFAAARGLNPSSDEANYQFLAHELRTSQSGELARLKQAQSASEAAKIFTGSERERAGFLRPRAEHYGPSIRYAEKAMGIESPQTKPTETSGATPVSQSPVTSGSTTSSSQEHDHGGEKQNNKRGGNAGESGKVVQAQTGTRNLPLNDRILGVLQKAADAAGVTAVVTSGAQPDFPKGPRTGSTRHDQSVGAADLHLTQNGRTLTDDNPEDAKIKRKFVEAAVSAGATGIGAAEGYMGKETMHVGFGTPAVWGVGGHKGNVASWLSGLNVSGNGQTPVSEPTQTTPTVSAPSAATSPATTSASTPVSEPTQTTPSEQATPVSQEAVTPGVSAPMTGMDTSAMMGMMGGMLPGGLGGILGMIGPMLESLLGSLAPTEAYAQQVEQPQNAEMLQALSNSMQATQMINQAAVQTQAQTEQQDMSQFSIPGTAPDAGVNPNQMSYQQAGYSYNYPWDVSWPDWASMIGGNHWSEMRKIKKNMWA